MKITVLMGGTSSERDVSLASGIRIVEALRARGHEVTRGRSGARRHQRRRGARAAAAGRSAPSRHRSKRCRKCRRRHVPAEPHRA